MNGMLNEKMFGPIEVPILKGVGRREITTFLAQYERYEAVRDSRALMGVDLQLIPKVNCVEPHLLNSIAVYEMFLDSKRDMDDEKLNEYFAKCLRISGSYLPDVEEAFRKLKFPERGESREKVLKFFTEADIIIQSNSLQYVEEKVIVKYLLRRIEPARFRSYIERTIEAKGKLNFQTRAELFPLVSQSLMEMDFWKLQMDKDSSNNTRRFESRTPSRKKLECFNCKGEHKAAVCPKKSMDYPIRNGQRSEGIRNGFNYNTKRGDQSAKAGATRPNSRWENIYLIPVRWSCRYPKSRTIFVPRGGLL